jgi:Na+/melibiose symporter-like transporter
MGYITDNIRTRWGRRRIFFILGAPMSLCFALMWVSGFGYAWYLGTYLLFSTVFTLLMVPYDTLPAEMTSRYDLRSKMSGARMLFAQATAFLAALIPGKSWLTSPTNRRHFSISASSSPCSSPCRGFLSGAAPGSATLFRHRRPARVA